MLARCASVLALLPAFHAGSAPAAEPASIVLVARPMVTDANFARTVVLVTRTPRHEVIGVILNRRMRDIDLPALLPDDAVLRDKVREWYFGGPLTPRGLFAAGPPPDAPAAPGAPGAAGAIAVLPGLTLAVGLARVRDMVMAHPDGQVKVFAGYAGWAPGQLEHEIAIGGWAVLSASAAIVFDPEPETQWERLTALSRAVSAPSGQSAGLDSERLPGLRALAWAQSACLVRTYSIRSIDRTSISRTSLPCSTLSGIASPALPPLQSLL